MSGWREVFALVLSGPVLLGVVAWLAKQIVSTQLKANADKELERLRNSFQLELERVKSSLQIATIEHQVRYSRLQEERAKLIAELYKLLVETHWEVQEFVLLHSFEKDAADNAYKKVIELYRFIEPHKLYFSVRVCGLLQHFESTLRHAVSQATVYLTMARDVDPTLESQEVRKVLKEVWNEIQTKIPETLSVLAEEFRVLLGVESSSLSTQPSKGPSDR